MIELIRLGSIALAPLVFAVALLVLFRYGRAAVLNRVPDEPNEWLVLGIAIGFAGKLFDNVYWACAWIAYECSGSDNFWFDFGCVVNVPFRQVALIVSGLCHLVALHRLGYVEKKRNVTFACLAAFVLFALCLFIGGC